jgi:hypothetical protein
MGGPHLAFNAHHSVHGHRNKVFRPRAFPPAAAAAEAAAATAVAAAATAAAEAFRLVHARPALNYVRLQRCSPPRHSRIHAVLMTA